MLLQDLYAIYKQHNRIQTDTRKLQQGDLFFALKGPNYNGNLFAQQALQAGAAYVVVDEPTSFTSDKIIQTPNVLATLQALAKYHRQQLSIPFIAITGSNGKTTTKELLHQVLSTTYTTYTTVGNLNNHIGVPLTILAVQPNAQMAIIEMGANHQKEIESYCNYTLPTHGIITNCGKAHIEGFGGEAGVKKGKGELYHFIKENKGSIFLMNDYDYLITMSQGIENIITYGTKQAQYTGFANDTALLSVTITKGLANNNSTIHTQLVGSYNLPNVLAAVAVGKYFNVHDEKIISALQNYTPSNSRSQLLHKGTNKIILDAYNANPTSMKAAIENMVQLTSNKKILLLGGMMEMGADSITEHTALVQLISQYTWQAVVLVGGDFKHIPHPFIYYNTATEAQHWLALQQFENATILIKGSRSMQMENVLG
jgi:UDP-N-acetylmuramoyl-tripeptide--D-alanyl-D-alanine ligase